MINALPDGLREALGHVIAAQRREWARERELIEAQSREAIAELRARIVELEAQARDKVAERLATVRDGRDADPEVMAAAVRDEVAKAVGAIPVPKNGEDGAGVHGARIEDGALVLVLSNGEERQVGRVLGEKGQDADPELVSRAVRDEVEKAVAAIPAPKDGEDGEDGEDGKDGIGVADVRLDDEMLVLVLSNGEERQVGKVVGPKGDPGPIGALKACEEWTDRVHYEGEVATFEGSVYQARCDTGRAPPHADWRCIARAGRDAVDGKDGRSFKVMGTFDRERTYAQLDVVTINGSSFVALEHAPGECPGPGWQMLACAGGRGNRGLKGDPGRKGDKGQPGVSIVEWHVDAERLMAVPIMSDGSEGPPLELSFCFEPFEREIRALRTVHAGR